MAKKGKGKWCDVVGTDKNLPIAKFVETLSATGQNPCDTCPYADCMASQAQVIRLRKAEEKYRVDHLPPCDRRVYDRRKEIAEELRKERKRTGRRGGRPRKVVVA